MQILLLQIYLEMGIMTWFRCTQLYAYARVYVRHSAPSAIGVCTAHTHTHSMPAGVVRPIRCDAQNVIITCGTHARADRTMCELVGDVAEAR